MDKPTERCVCCGDEIPEGRQVCPKCLLYAALLTNAIQEDNTDDED